MHLVRFQNAAGEIRLADLNDTKLTPLDVDDSWGDDPLLELIRRNEGRLQAAASELTRGEVIELSEVKLVAPIARPPKIICVGLNYTSHMIETNSEKPSEPVIFSKYAASIVGPDEAVVLPAVAPRRVDYEAELAVVIGKHARNVSESDAMDVVAGYTVANDVTARDWQLKKPNGQWLLGKTFDTFLPLGPAVVTPEDVPDHRDLRVQCRVSGDSRQDASTSELLFSVEEVIAYVSRVFTLEPGDLILTGTPGGVAMVRGKEAYLQEGDVLETEISTLGTLRNPVVAEDPVA